MKRVRWGRIILVLIILAILIIGGYSVLRSIFTPTLAPSQVETLPDGTPISLPDLPKTPATMSNEERESAIEQARQDAIEAAKATGQNNDNVQKAGDAAAKAARKTFYPAQNDGGLGG